MKFVPHFRRCASLAGVFGLLLCAAAQPAIQPAAPGVRWAVIISIDRASPNAAPANVELVGRDLAATLRSSYGYENIVELSGAAATQERIFRLRDDLRDKVKPGDSVLIVVLTEWTTLTSGEVALVPADSDPSQSWTFLKLADLRETVASIRASSVAVLIDRCLRSEYESYANAPQITKGGSYTRSRSGSVIVTGCVRSSNERGAFIRRFNQTLANPTASGVESGGSTRTLSNLLTAVTQTRAIIDVDVQDSGGAAERFLFTRAGGVIDPELEGRIRNRTVALDSRQDALNSLATTVAQEKPGSPLSEGVGKLLDQLALDGDEETGMRIAAVRHLGSLRYPRAVGLFESLITGESNPPELRIAALESFESFDAELTHDTILKASSASNADVRAEAVAQLRHVARPTDTLFLLERLAAEDAEKPLLALVQTAVSLEIPAEQLRPALEGLIASPSRAPQARSEALRAIGRIGLQESFPVLEKVLADKSAPIAVRQNAAYAIGKLNFTDPALRTRAAEFTAQFARESDPGVRKGVADTLGRLKSPDSRAALEQLARDKDASVREVAVPALGQFGDLASAPVLESLVLKDSSAAVRGAAARALAEVGGPNAGAVLAKAAGDPDPGVRRAAAEALKKYEGGDDSTAVIIQQIYSAKIPREKARAIRLLPAKDDPKIVAALVSSLEIDDNEVQTAVIDKLGQTGGVESVRQLKSALESRDDGTRERAALALGRIGERSDPASPQWQSALTALVNMPRDSDTRVRSAAARALGGFAHPTALTAIMQYADDERGDVKFGAADGLRALAANYSRLNNPKMAVDAAGRAVKVREHLMGPRHVETATEYNNLGAYHLLSQEWRDAEEALQRALSIREGTLGAYDLDTAVSLANLATVYQRTGDLKRAEPLFQRVLTIRERALSSSDPAVLQTLENLSAVYIALGDRDRAEKYRQRLQYSRGAKAD